MYFLYKETDVRLNHDTKNLINTHTHTHPQNSSYKHRLFLIQDASELGSSNIKARSARTIRLW